MPTKCPKCGVVLDASGNATIIHKVCGTCQQTEELKRINQRNRIDEECRRTGQTNTHTPSHGGGGSGGSGSGCVGLLVVIVIVGFAGMWGWGKFSDWRKGPEAVRKDKIEEIERKKKEVIQSLKDEADPFSNRASDSARRDAAKKLAELENEKRNLLKEQAQAAEPPATSSSANDAKRAVPGPQILKSLEGVPLPCTVIVIEKFSLLNAASKETEIPTGWTIKILSRKKLGTLETEINGRLFVGNESRLAGKVKLR